MKIPSQPTATGVLHLEDDPHDAEMIRSKLRAEGLHCDLNLVKNREQFEAGLAQKRFDLILCDYCVPNFGHGFTTKKDGHGFGLHSSALAAKELGGAMNAYSEGS